MVVVVACQPIAKNVLEAVAHLVERALRTAAVASRVLHWLQNMPLAIYLDHHAVVELLLLARRLRCRAIVVFVHCFVFFVWPSCFGKRHPDGMPSGGQKLYLKLCLKILLVATLCKSAKASLVLLGSPAAQNLTENLS